MRYWAYINDKVVGPYDENQLAALDGFTPETLICAEETEPGGSQEWIKASAIFEFDQGTRTINRPSVYQETPEQFSSQQTDKSNFPAEEKMDAASTQLLIEKIDKLTQQIESMQGKLDEALSAAALAQAAATQQFASNKQAQEKADWETPVSEEALITSTASLLHHADELVAQAETPKDTQEKPIDFLDEIQIGDTSLDDNSEKGGEEVVLRSALDSLYHSREQSEEEKESTFQDLLSPFKENEDTAPTAEAAATPAAEEVVADTAKAEQEISQETPVAQTASSDKKEEEIAPVEQQVSAEEQPQQTEEPVVTKPEEQQQAPAIIQQEEKQEEPVITPEQREEIIDEITAPAAHEDLIAQAIAEAEKEQVSSSETAKSQDEPAAEAQEPIFSDMPSISAADNQAEKSEEASPLEDLPEQKQALDLDLGNEQLTIAQEELPEKEVSEEQSAELAQVKEKSSLPSDTHQQSGEDLTPMSEPEQTDTAEKEEEDDAIKELVPGKEIEPERNDGIISQADLDAAFQNHTIQEDFPDMQQQPLPQSKNFYDPKDMTEVQLSAGSTYLISDFIPPGDANAPAAADTSDSFKGEEPSSQETTEAIEEIIPQVSDAKRVESSTQQGENLSEDLTMSKVILENTIKTKRGATMDIKTVPMVQEPADSERLDLTNSDLDINAQHDLKAADFQQPRSSATKVVLGSLVSLVFIVLIYVMLAYLEIIPAEFNLLRTKQSLPETAATETLDGDILPDTDMFQLPDGVADEVEFQTEGQTADSLDAKLDAVKNYVLPNGKTLQQVINDKHPNQQAMIEWNITTAVEPDNYSVLVKVPPENPQSFKISYRFNFNAVTNTLEPTISDSKNLLDSIK